jgi:enoyl-CoA hydratase
VKRTGRRAAFRALLLEQAADGIALITLNRPEVRNAISLQVVQEMHAALDRLAADPRTRVVILTGASDERAGAASQRAGAGVVAFASGADIRELRGRRAPDALRGINSSLFLKVEQFPLPTIAAVRGVALGGGCELALACDIRVAGESARFGQPEVGLGILPAAGATYRLPRLVGHGRARELIFTGRIIDAGEALRIGLVNAVVPDDDVLPHSRAMARTIAAKGPMAVRAAKLTLAASAYGPEPGHAAERLAQAILFESADMQEGMGAFLDKRRPKFRGK